MKSLRKWFETGKICVPFAVILFLPVNLIAAAGELTVAVDPARSAETVPLNTEDSSPPTGTQFTDNPAKCSNPSNFPAVLTVTRVQPSQ